MFKNIVFAFNICLSLEFWIQIIFPQRFACVSFLSFRVTDYLSFILISFRLCAIFFCSRTSMINTGSYNICLFPMLLFLELNLQENGIETLGFVFMSTMCLRACFHLGSDFMVNLEKMVISTIAKLEDLCFSGREPLF